jgi:hypothetical protein
MTTLDVLQLFCTLLQGTQGTGITDFGREALLAREFLWDAISTRLPAPGTKPLLLAAMHALLAQRAALLPHELIDYLEASGPGISALLHGIDVRTELQSSPLLDRIAALGIQGVI